MTGQLSLAVPNAQRLHIFLATQSQSLPFLLFSLNFGSSSQVAVGQLSHVTGQLSLAVPNAQRLEIFLATQSQSLFLSFLCLNFGSSSQAP